MTRTYREGKRMGFDLDAAVAAAYELGVLDGRAEKDPAPDNTTALARTREQLRTLLKGHRHVLALVMARVAFVPQRVLGEAIGILQATGQEGAAARRSLTAIYRRDFGIAVHSSCYNAMTSETLDTLLERIRRAVPV